MPDSPSVITMFSIRVSLIPNSGRSPPNSLFLIKFIINTILVITKLQSFGRNLSGRYYYLFEFNQYYQTYGGRPRRDCLSAGSAVCLERGRGGIVVAGRSGGPAWRLPVAETKVYILVRTAMIRITFLCNCFTDCRFFAGDRHGVSIDGRWRRGDGHWKRRDDRRSWRASSGAAVDSIL